MTATSRAPRTRAQAATRPLPPQPKAEDKQESYKPPEVPGGIIRFTTEDPEERAEKRSVLFSIDDSEFTVLDNPPASLGLEYLDVSRKLGPLAAVSWAMEAMLGRDGYAALKAFKGITPGGLQRVVEVVTEKILGSLDDPKGR